MTESRSMEEKARLEALARPRYLGYTTNGRTYNIPKDDTKNLPEGDADVKEEWMKQQGYVVIQDLANYRKYARSKKEISEAKK